MVRTAYCVLRTAYYGCSTVVLIGRTLLFFDFFLMRLYRASEVLRLFLRLFAVEVIATFNSYKYPIDISCKISYFFCSYSQLYLRCSAGRVNSPQLRNTRDTEPARLSRMLSPAHRSFESPLESPAHGRAARRRESRPSGRHLGRASTDSDQSDGFDTVSSPSPASARAVHPRLQHCGWWFAWGDPPATRILWPLFDGA